MSRIKTEISGNFSYILNGKSLVNSTMNGTALFIDILTDSIINMKLEPKLIENAQIYTPYKFTLTAENMTNEEIENFNLKLNADENLKYIPDSLVNPSTGKYYPGKNWRQDYCDIGTLSPNEIIVLEFYMKIYPLSEYYPSSPLLAYNSTSTSLDKSNDTFTSISEAKISISFSDDGKKIHIQNTGTTPSYAFTYKYSIPSGSQYTSALLNGEIFNDISYSQFAAYAIFKIGPLPVSTISTPEVLTINFS